MQSQKGKPAAEGTGGTPIWVWIVYALGILAASILVLSVLFTLGAYLLSDDVHDQVLASHAQPVPAMDASASPGGAVSVTVTGPLVAAAFIAR